MFVFPLYDALYFGLLCVLIFMYVFVLYECMYLCIYMYVYVYLCFFSKYILMQTFHMLINFCFLFVLVSCKRIVICVCSRACTEDIKLQSLFPWSGYRLCIIHLWITILKNKLYPLCSIFRKITTQKSILILQVSTQLLWLMSRMSFRNEVHGH